MRLTVKEAAALLGLPEQSVRSWIQKGTCPFGEVICDCKSKHGRRTYYVNKQRLEAYLSGKL